MSTVLGIDVGATGIKGNLVDTRTGKLLKERYKIETPELSTPDNVTKGIKEIVDHFKWGGNPIGIGFPSIVYHGKTITASNVHEDWVYFDAENYFIRELKAKVKLINDADAAGLAELHYGAARGVMGTVILLTLGTGIGSAIFRDGMLLPNTELGHLKYKKTILEHYAANSARERKNLSFTRWGNEVQNGLLYIEHLFSPDLFIIGGGISKKFSKFSRHLKSVKAEIIPAEMRNNAGIIGAAMIVDF